MDKFQSSLGYIFNDPGLLRQALQHRSAGKDNNERLEFFGDAILGFIISSFLFQRFPTASEGELSRLRAALVQQASLAAVARSLHLGEHLILGPGELKSGGANRDSILADALEAVICALYLDAGMDQCMAKVRQWFGPLLQEEQVLQPSKDAKTRLQELLQSRRQSLPVYQVVEIGGKDHQQVFVISCTLPQLGESFRGSGHSRKQAEQQAAQAALDRLADGASGATP